MKKVTIVFLAVLALMSCKKKSDESPNDNQSRTVRYEITGNFTGSIIAAHTAASGGITNEEVTTLPWTKEITYAANVTAAIIAVNGRSGVAGQKITLVIKKGGVQIGTPLVVTANSSGSFSEAAPAMIL